MKKIKLIALKTIKKVTEKKVENQYSNWPVCNGIFYQPKRPKTKRGVE